jgi:hypothetical protein
MRDRALVARAVRARASAEWAGDDVMFTLHISPGEIGHAFPTGDMFRQVIVRVWTSEPAAVGAGEPDTGEPPQGARRIVLRRWFAPMRIAADAGVRYVQGQRADTRLAAPDAGGSRRIDVRLVRSARAVSSARSADSADAVDAVDAVDVHWRVDLVAREPYSELLAGVPRSRWRTPVAAGIVRVPAR